MGCWRDFLVLKSVPASCAAQLLKKRIRTKKSMKESSQRAHATFENGADPSGTDRGLNLSSVSQIRGGGSLNSTNETMIFSRVQNRYGWIESQCHYINTPKRGRCNKVWNNPMYICATYQIFEEMIFAKVGVTIWFLIKSARSAELTILDAGKKHKLGEFCC